MEMLYGKYTLSSFYDIFSAAEETGADLIRSKFTDADTAQSIAAPYSYQLDFGIYGVAIIALLSAVIMQILYSKAIVNKSNYYKIIYAIIFLTTLWSIRSGTSLINISLFYIVVGTTALTRGGSNKFKLFRRVCQVLLVASLSVSLATLAYRI